MVCTIYLASGSPRRRELLEQLGVQYEQILPETDESQIKGETPLGYVTRLAKLKAMAGYKMLSEGEGDKPVLGADTIVLLDGRVYGKPLDGNDAYNMLMTLSGHTHQVISAVAVISSGKEKVVSCVSSVQFRTIDASEAKAYCMTEEPMDKAGSYAIQGKGAVFVEKIEGSYSGIVGLPLMETAALLREFGIDVLASCR